MYPLTATVKKLGEYDPTSYGCAIHAQTVGEFSVHSTDY